MYNNTNKKTNFYFKIATNENEAVEVYVGQSSGKQLQNDIESAKSEVLIISPYIDESKLKDLIKLKYKNINVRLAFSSLNIKQESRILKMLIHQNKHIDTIKKEKIEQQIKLYNYFTIGYLLVGAFAFVLSINKMIELKTLNYYFILPILFSYLFYSTKKQIDKLKKTPIFRYDYIKKLDFKFLRTSSNEAKFIHSKIYVIDKKIAYLGSINFTNNGFTSNFETRIRITHEDKVNELVDFVNTFFDDDENFKKHELNWLGRKVYDELKY